MQSLASRWATSSRTSPS